MPSSNLQEKYKEFLEVKTTAQISQTETKHLRVMLEESTTDAREHRRRSMSLEDRVRIMQQELDENEEKISQLKTELQAKDRELERAHETVRSLQDVSI